MNHQRTYMKIIQNDIKSQYFIFIVFMKEIGIPRRDLSIRFDYKCYCCCDFESSQVDDDDDISKLNEHYTYSLILTNITK